MQRETHVPERTPAMVRPERLTRAYAMRLAIGRALVIFFGDVARLPARVRRSQAMLAAEVTMGTRFRLDSGQEVLVLPETAAVDAAAVAALAGQGLLPVKNAKIISDEVAALTHGIGSIEEVVATGARILFVQVNPESTKQFFRGEVIDDGDPGPIEDYGTEDKGDI